MRRTLVLATLGCFLSASNLGCEGTGTTTPTVNPNPIKADPTANDLKSAPGGGKAPAAKTRKLGEKNLSEP
jgi:hypothetical protein